MSILATSLPMLPVFYWPWRRALPASALLPRGAAVHLSCEQPHAEIDDAQLLACGWNIYCPRSAREATWATERALVSSGVSAVAAWFACCPADRRASEGRLLRRLRALARRHGKSLLILRYGATPG